MFTHAKDLPPERRQLFKYKGAWAVKPAGAAYAIGVKNWSEGIRIITLSENEWLDWYGSNLMF